MFHLKLIYLLCFIAILQQATARPIMRRMATPLSNPYARNSQLLKILDEYDYDLDTKNTDILTKPRNTSKNTLTFTTESKKEEKQLLKPPIAASNDYSDIEADEDEDTYDATAPATAADSANGGIVNDNEPDDEEPSDLNKSIFLKKSRKSKSKLNKKRNSQAEPQRTTTKHIKYYDKADHLSAEELDIVLAELSLKDLQALSDFLDRNVIAEGTASFLESNLRSPYHYIIRMDEPSQLHHSYPREDYHDNVKLQDSAIKPRRQSQAASDEEEYYKTTYRTKRQSLDNSSKVGRVEKTEVFQLLTNPPKDKQNEEYLKLLAFSFPQDSRQKAGSDNEFTHLRVKRN